MALVAALGPVFVCSSCVCELGLFDPDLSDAAIHAMGDRLVADIEAWHKKNGRYPYSLVEAGLGSPIWLNGGFRYKSSGTAFELELITDLFGMSGHSYHSQISANGMVTPGWHCWD